MANFSYPAGYCLDINVDNTELTCVGTAHRSGERCRRRISAHNRNRASELLGSLSFKDPYSQEGRELMRQIAQCLLCSPNHQSRQLAGVVEMWLGRLTAMYPYCFSEPPSPPPETRRRFQSESTAEDTSFYSAYITNAASIPSITAGSSSRRVSTASEARTFRPPALQFASARRQASQRPGGAAPPAIAPASHVTSYAPSTFLSSRTATLQSNVSPRTSAPAAPNTSNTVAASTSDPSRMKSRWRNCCTTPHVKRRPLRGDCVICKELLISSTSFVWCKSECGINYHATCFEEWAEACHATERRVTCCNCRTPWAINCEHDNVEPELANGRYTLSVELKDGMEELTNRMKQLWKTMDEAFRSSMTFEETD